MRELCVLIADMIESYVEGLRLGEDKYEVNLAELGINSIIFIQTIVEIEDKFQIEIPDEYLLFDNMNTVYKMATIIMELKEYEESGTQ